MDAQSTCLGCVTVLVIIILLAIITHKPRQRKAARKLAQEGSLKAIRTLTEKVSQSKDQEVQRIAMEALQQLTAFESIDVVCEIWLTSRQAQLEKLMLNKRWVASAPLQSRIFSALKTEQVDLVVAEGVAAVEWLLRASQDKDLLITKQAQAALEQLQTKPEVLELLCDLMIKQDHTQARKIVLDNHYTPQDPQQRAIFYFLSGQWDKYEQLDFEGSLLKAVYQQAPHNLRQRITKSARQAGRVEWAKMVASERKQQQQPIAKTDEEWETVLTLLSQQEQWPEIWRLIDIAPAGWSKRLLKHLKLAKWLPQDEDEQLALAKLLKLAEACMGDIPPLRRLTPCLATLKGHRGKINTLAITLDGHKVVSGSDDKSVRLWQLPTGSPLKTLDEGLGGQVGSLAVSPDGQILASGGGGWDYAIELLWLPDGTPLKTLKKHKKQIRELTISNDGKFLSSASDDKTICLWSLPDGQLVKTLKGHKDDVKCVAFSPAGQLLATGSQDKTLRLWSLPTGEALNVLEGHKDTIHCLAITPRGQLLVSGADDKTICLWELPSGRLLKTLAGFSDKAITSLAISPNGQLLASGNTDKMVRLWRLPEGTPLTTLEGHEDAVRCLAISPAGQLLASGSNDKTVRLWQLSAIRLSHIPIEQSTLQDITWVQKTLQSEDISDNESNWLNFLLALMRWSRRFDVELEKIEGWIESSEFDIELEA